MVETNYKLWADPRISIGAKILVREIQFLKANDLQPSISNLMDITKSSREVIQNLVEELIDYQYLVIGYDPDTLEDIWVVRDRPFTEIELIQLLNMEEFEVEKIQLKLPPNTPSYIDILESENALLREELTNLCKQNEQTFSDFAHFFLAKKKNNLIKVDIEIKNISEK